MKMKKNFLRNWFILLSLLGIIGFFGYHFYVSSLKMPVDPKGSSQAFVVQKGESLTEVAQRLQKDGLIRSGFIFKSEIKKLGQDKNILPGDFKLSPAMSLVEVIKVLTKEPQDRWVTLLEGWRVEEVASKLSLELGIDGDEFIQKAKKDEGYLFPDTYLFNKDASIETIISTLKNTFATRYSDEIQAKVKLNGLTPEQGVILASIVEREARSDEVRTKVASILIKRLKIGMGLNVDASIQYALGYQAGEKSWWKRHLTRDDLKVDSPFNSYLHAGLPPHPICNPSLSSLKAVGSATVTPYLYYYHDLAGNSYYATTLEEHNENVANNP